MRLCILNAIIAVILTNGAYADDETNKNKLIKTYDSAESPSQSLDSPRPPNDDQITAVNQLDNDGFNNINGHHSDGSIKFKDENHNPDIDKSGLDSDLIDISFKSKSSELNVNQLAIGHKIEAEPDRRDTENQIKFEDSYDDPKGSNEEDLKNRTNKSSSDNGHVLFEGDVNSDRTYADKSDFDVEITEKKFKFENSDDESDLESHTERVVFVDDSSQNQEPVRKKIYPERKRRVLKSPDNATPTDPNLPYPTGLGYSGYPGIGFPSTGSNQVQHPNSGIPTTGYVNYPVPGYQVPGYPYPGYPSLYSGVIYPTTGYSGFPLYPGIIYPPITSAYSAYQTSGHQKPGDIRPPTIPITYTSPGQNNQAGHTDTMYPYQYASTATSPVTSGSPTSSVTQSGKPGASYPGPQYPHYQRYPIPGYSQAYPGDPNPQYFLQNLAQYKPGYPGVQQPGYQPGLYSSRPTRRQKSLTQRAVSAVAEALTSIALYDDYQCVPRLLCEVAGGTAATSPTLQKATAGLQPLLSVLQSYSGLSTSPLFIFGRAAAMGVSAKGSPSVCYRTYPQCPSEPDKLVNYLNNHNGGFFRFFGQPDVAQQPQNLEQFYNHLSGQYGFQKQPQQNLGSQSPYSYGLQSQQYNANPQNYRANYYHEQNNLKKGNPVESDVEERIQNKPSVNDLDDDNDLGAIEDTEQASKWLFPDEANTENEREKVIINKHPERPNRASKTVKFPDDRSEGGPKLERPRDHVRKAKRLFFPGESYLQLSQQSTTLVNSEDYVFDHKHNFYVKRPAAENNVDVVYVVRGNGDPNHPEIVKVRPGHSV